MSSTLPACPLIPLSDHLILVRDETEEHSGGGVFLPDTAREKHKPQEGTILRVGPGRLLESGTRPGIYEGLKPGARALFKRFAGSEFHLDGNVFLIVAEHDILAIAEPAAAKIGAQLEPTPSVNEVVRVRDKVFNKQ